jgi:predicted RNA-binding Zn ribbon-like protein
VSSLAADLVNTRPRPGEPEKLTGPDAVVALLSPYGLDAAPVAGLRRVRDELLPAFDAGDMASLAAVLNPLLARGGTLRLLPGAPGWSLRAPTEDLSPADRVAVAAAAELAALAAQRGLDRLGFCAADDCQAVFADTSPRGDRRYCSRTCSTRMNVRRHRKQ